MMHCMLAQTFHEFSNGDMGSFATLSLHFAMGGYAVAGRTGRGGNAFAWQGEFKMGRCDWSIFPRGLFWHSL